MQIFIMRKNKEENKAIHIIKSVAVIVFWLAVWDIVTHFANANLMIPIPNVRQTVLGIVHFSTQSDFWFSVIMSILRISAGFLLALVIGFLCAVLSSYIPLFKALFDPILKTVRAVPVASFIILIYLWISNRYIPIFISFSTVLPIIWAQVESGISKTDKSLVEMARVMGMNDRQIIRKIVLAGVKPYFTTAAATGLGFAWKSGVAAEVICRTKISLGNILWEGKSVVEYEKVFAVTAVIIVISIALEKGIKYLLERRKNYD